MLVRGVGPSLAPFGVVMPLSDPAIALYRQGEQTPFATNDNWDEQPNADEIAQTTTSMGIFPLASGSLDAAHLVELPAGAYTVHLNANGDEAGTALIEIYIVP